MLRALLWKEWTQLRALRWTGLALGLLLPAILAAGAESARRGLSPFGSIPGYTPRQILVDALPLALALGLWPLVTLLAGAQAFTADRAAGTESFLLERPVPRGRIWRSRAIALVATISSVVIGSLLVWALLVLAMGGPGGAGWVRTLEVLGWGGLTVALALGGVLAASSLPGPPIASVLLGLLLGGAPVLLLAPLSSAFPYARSWGISLAILVPPILLVGYVAASFFAFSLGEPAGRGRTARSVLALLLSPVAAVAVFAMIAPRAIRIEYSGFDRFDLDPPSGGGSALLVPDEPWRPGLSLFDVGTARRVAFLPPPNEAWAWNPDGSRLALLTRSGPLGSMTQSRVSFFDAAGRTSERPWIPGDEYFYIDHLWWAGDQLVVQGYRGRLRGSEVELPEPQPRLFLVRPETGEAREIAVEVPVDVPFTHWGVSVAGGHVVVAMASGAAAAGGEPKGRTGSVAQEAGPIAGRVKYGLHRLDLDRGLIDPRPVAEDRGFPFYVAGRLSPSGRYWLRDRRGVSPTEVPVIEPASDGPADAAVLDLESNAFIASPGGRWLTGDLLARVERDGEERRLVLEKPGERPRVVRAWTGLDLAFEPSPDLERILVTAGKLRGRPDPTERITETIEAARVQPEQEWIYEIATDRWTSVPPWHRAGAGEDGSAGLLEDRDRRVWAGPRTLARIGPRLLAFEDIDAPGKLRYAFGG